MEKKFRTFLNFVVHSRCRLFGFKFIVLLCPEDVIFCFPCAFLIYNFVGWALLILKARNINKFYNLMILYGLCSVLPSMPYNNFMNLLKLLVWVEFHLIK